VNSGLIRLIRVGELPLQLRRNREPLGERAKALEELGPFLWRHRESDAQPSRIGVKWTPLSRQMSSEFKLRPSFQSQRSSAALF
jgi:hypothetical protein